MKRLINSNWKIGTIALIILFVGTTSNLNASDWWEKIKINGDFRYRHEYTDEENSVVRHRQRIRARVNIIGKVSDASSNGFGLLFGGMLDLSAIDQFFCKKTLKNPPSGLTFLCNLLLFD